MAVYKEGDSLVCREVHDLHDGQGGASEAAWHDVAYGGSHVEMGKNHHGFYHQVAEEGQGL